MSKLAKTTKGNDGAPGKAKQRHDSRLKRWESEPKDTRHQHHKPGSMNAKKTGR